VKKDADEGNMNIEVLMFSSGTIFLKNLIKLTLRI
jgi:hypothetical protein